MANPLLGLICNSKPSSKDTLIPVGIIALPKDGKVYSIVECKSKPESVGYAYFG